ncbi:MAG: HAMP domain-containing histidine kinase [Acidobacteriaceae bacterium]|nr:HAMP domain-containing histidine kinase [Acidobacteriaceae bacterium]
MNPNSSFRLRLLLGSVLWTLGLLALAHMIFRAIVLRPHFVFTSADPIIIGLALLFAFGGLIAVRSGLIPFRLLRERLLDVREGSLQTVTGSYPSEVQPLVDDLNSLLEQRDRAVREAQAKAGDLAHGLKTPLAIIAQEAERLEREGHTELAVSIGLQIERMRRQIEYQLAQARAAATGNTPGVRSSVKESALGLSRTLQRLHADRALAIDIEACDEHFVRVQREDLDEILGNLLDNACKWTATRVVLSSRVANRELLILVEDDGPGIAPSVRESVLRRGVRADQTAPGSGLGLAIVRRLVELYRGSISLEQSSMGGLRVTVHLPFAG